MTLFDKQRRECREDCGDRKLKLLSDILFNKLSESTLTIGEFLGLIGYDVMNYVPTYDASNEDTVDDGDTIYQFLEEIRDLNGRVYEESIDADDEDDDNDDESYARSIRIMFGVLGYTVKYVDNGIEVGEYDKEVQIDTLLNDSSADDVYCLRILGRLFNKPKLRDIPPDKTIMDYTIPQINELVREVGLVYSGFEYYWND